MGLDLGRRVHLCTMVRSEEILTLFVKQTNMFLIHSGKCLKRAVISLSKKQLKPTQRKVLEKGLKFVPRLRSIREHEIQQAFHKLRRRMFINSNFQNVNTIERYEHPFKGPSEWQPPPTQNKKLIKYLDSVEQRIVAHLQDTKHGHLANHRTMTSVLKQLDKDHELVIKPADKGGALVLWGKESHTYEAFRQLLDTKFYVLCAMDDMHSLI